MFTTPCFIRKNTPELREKLEKLGYTCSLYLFGGGFISIGNLFYLRTLPTKCQYQGMQTLMHNSSVIDCGKNEEMFLALAALRDDTDRYQQFVCIESYCDYFDLFHDIGHFAKCITDRMPDSKYWRKATAEEIIEHFTMKGGTE